MKEDYRIEDLTFQKEGMVVYRALGKDNQEYALTVLTYRGDVEERLTERIFEKAYRDLSARNHRCLRKAAEGGININDKQIWIAHLWCHAPMLNDLIFRRPIHEKELLQIEADCESLIAGLGDRADCLDFDMRSISIGVTTENTLRSSFVMNYWQWFHDWTLQTAFGGGRDAREEMRKLIASFDKNGNYLEPQLDADGNETTQGPIIKLPEAKPKQPDPAAEAPKKVTSKLVTASSRLAEAATKQTNEPAKIVRRTLATPANAAAAQASKAPQTSHSGKSSASATSPSSDFSQAPQAETSSIPGLAKRKLITAQVNARPPSRHTSVITVPPKTEATGTIWAVVGALVLVLCIVVGVKMSQEQTAPTTPVISKKEILQDPDEGLEKLSKLSDIDPDEDDAEVSVDEILNRTAKLEIETVKAADPKPKITNSSSLPEASPNRRPLPVQITDVEADNQVGLKLKEESWVRVKGVIEKTSPDGEWRFGNSSELTAFLSDGQLEVLEGVQVEVLGYLVTSKRLQIDEEFDISFPGKGAPPE